MTKLLSEPIVFDGLAHSPVRVFNCRWIPKIVTTDPPRYIPHTEYSWECRLVGDAPFLAALILDTKAGVYWSRLSRVSSSAELKLGLAFSPFDWNRSEDVSIHFSQDGHQEYGGVSFKVHDTALKKDPRDFVRFDLDDGNVLQTGTLVRTGTVSSHDSLTAQFVIVAQTDTESCRCSRWRLKRNIKVNPPATLMFLKSGRRAGSPTSGR